MKYPEVAPTIIVDKDLGEALHNLDIDVDSCTQFLKRFGMDNDAINNLEVHFTADTLVDYEYDYQAKNEDAGIKINTTLGKYFPDLDTVDLCLGSVIVTSDKKDASNQASRTLTHEFIHALHDYYGLMPESSNKNKGLIIGLMGSLATIATISSMDADPKLYPLAGVTGTLLYMARRKYMNHKLIQEEDDTCKQTDMVHPSNYPNVSLSLKKDASRILTDIAIKKVHQAKIQNIQPGNCPIFGK